MADNYSGNVSCSGSILTNGGGGGGGGLKKNNNNKNRVKRRHSVDFVSHAHIVEIEKVSSDESVKEEMWYSKEEYELIKTRNSLVVKMMKNGQFRESDEFSLRGLEHRLKPGMRERADHKFGGLNAVLIEQDRQYAKSGKISNLDSIAFKYTQASHDAKDSAVCNALLDAAASYCRVDGAPLVIVTGVVGRGDDDHNDHNDDELSIVSDMESVMTETVDSNAHHDWGEKKLKLQAIFKTVAARKKDKTHRRASM
jgi:hypothetical protein